MEKNFNQLRFWKLVKIFYAEGRKNKFTFNNLTGHFRHTKFNDFLLLK